MKKARSRPTSSLLAARLDQGTLVLLQNHARAGLVSMLLALRSNIDAPISLVRRTRYLGKGKRLVREHEPLA